MAYNSPWLGRSQLAQGPPDAPRMVLSSEGVPDGGPSCLVLGGLERKGAAGVKSSLERSTGLNRKGMTSWVKAFLVRPAHASQACGRAPREGAPG